MTRPVDLFPTLTQTIDALEVGEKEEFPISRKATVRRIASRLQDRFGRRYVCRSTPDGCCQVWRTA